MSEDGAERTALKLKVRNRESGLLEWRPCVCTIAQDQLVLEPSLGSDSDDEGNGAGVGRTTPIIRVDLASQLQHIELKRKNKARCEFIYTTSDGGRASEELMAPSAKICQQWVDQVRDAQQCAQRQASIRKGAMMAQFRAASVSPLPANMGVGSGPTSQQPGDMLERASFTLLPNDLVVKECSNAMAATDNESSTVSSDPFQPLVMVNNTNALDASVSSSGVSYTLPTDQLKRFQASNHSQERRHESDNEMSAIHSPTSLMRVPRPSERNKDLSASAVSSCSSSSSSSITDAIHPGRFMASEKVHRRSTSSRYHSAPYGDINNDEDDESHDLLLVSPRSRSRVSAAIRRQRLRLERRQQERDYAHLQNRKRYNDSSRVSAPSSRSPCFRHRRGSLASPSDLADSFHSLRMSKTDAMAQYDSFSNQEDIDDIQLHPSRPSDSSSRSELRMLVRVEEVLRQLEQENAERKQREEALAAQVQSLQDALRIKSTEREHVAREFRVALRDKEKWQQSAQNAERMASQLREELAIAREEAQLLARDKLRLKRQNGELLAQVHRLDSLVYGRF